MHCLIQYKVSSHVHVYVCFAVVSPSSIVRGCHGLLDPEDCSWVANVCFVCSAGPIMAQPSMHLLSTLFHAIQSL